MFSFLAEEMSSGDCDAAFRSQPSRAAECPARPVCHVLVFPVVAVPDELLGIHQKQTSRAVRHSKNSKVSCPPMKRKTDVQEVGQVCTVQTALYNFTNPVPMM